MLADDFLGGVTLEALCSSIPAADVSLRRKHVDRVVGYSGDEDAELIHVGMTLLAIRRCCFSQMLRIVHVAEGLDAGNKNSTPVRMGHTRRISCAMSRIAAKDEVACCRRSSMSALTCQHLVFDILESSAERSKVPRCHARHTVQLMIATSLNVQLLNPRLLQRLQQATG